MFSSYFGLSSRVNEAETAFNQALEFKAINKSIQVIKNKRDRLQEDVKATGATQIDFIKLHVLIELTKKLDEMINAYNVDQANAEAQTKLALAIVMYDCVNGIWTQSRAALQTHRDDMKSTAGTVANYGIWAAAIAAGFTVPVTFFGSGILTYYLANKAGNATAKNLGWYDYEAHTAKIVRTLKDELAKMISSLQYVSGQETTLNVELFGSASDVRRHRRTENSGMFMRVARQVVDQVASSSTSVATLLEAYNPATQSYIDKIMPKKFGETIENFKLSDEEMKLFDDFKDPVSLSVCNVPVILNGKIYDLDSLNKIEPDSNGQRKDPSNRYAFYLRDIQPAWEEAGAMEVFINDINVKRNDVVESAASISSSSTSSTNEPRRLGM